MSSANDESPAVGENRTVTTEPLAASELLKRYGGTPTHREFSEGQGDHGLIRLVFPDSEEPSLDDSLTEISWETFHEEFEEKELALIYPTGSPDDPATEFELVKQDTL